MLFPLQNMGFPHQKMLFPLRNMSFPYRSMGFFCQSTHFFSQSAHFFLSEYDISLVKYGLSPPKYGLSPPKDAFLMPIQRNLPGSPVPKGCLAVWPFGWNLSHANPKDSFGKGSSQGVHSQRSNGLPGRMPCGMDLRGGADWHGHDSTFVIRNFMYSRLLNSQSSRLPRPGRHAHR